MKTKTKEKRKKNHVKFAFHIGIDGSKIIRTLQINRAIKLIHNAVL